MKTNYGKLAACEDRLREAAINQAGFDDFGDVTHRQGLRALLEGIDADYLLTEIGWRNSFDAIVGILIGRLYAHRGWAEHPNVLSTPIRRPLVVIGLPRTGTTALHRLLSVDPQFQGLELWLAATPMIRPDREARDALPEYRDCIARCTAINAKSPSLRTAHDLSASQVEECFYVLMQSFFSHNWGPALPSYASWLRTQDLRFSYRYYADVLRLIGAHEPHRRWLLKYPLHMMELNALLDEFRDACIIQTHRDPVEAIPSWYSLYQATSQSSSGRPTRSDLLGQQLLRYGRQSLDRTYLVRQNSSAQFFDVDYRLFVSSPLSVVHSIYDRFGLALCPRVKRSMEAYVMSNPMSRSGKHRYDLQSFNVTTDQIISTFENYRSQHGFH